MNMKWLPNVLSGSRGILAVPIYLAAAHTAWQLAFWLLVLALITDFLDGLAAKKLHAESTLGGHIDRVSDFLLAASGVAGLIVGAHTLPIWTLYAAVPVSGFIAYVKFFLAEETLVRRITSIFSLSLLFVAWIYIAWGFLTEAFGWSWAYPPVTFVLLATAGLLKRHRLRAWFGWLLPSGHRTQ